MSETVKVRNFCSQPMGTKPISEVPGVGPMAAKKLKSMEFTNATDLYNRLEKLKFDEKRFRIWLQLNCKGAKVSTIYRALMGWRAQFSGRRSDAGTDADDSESAPPARAARPPARGGAPPPAPAPAPRRPRSSVQFDMRATEREDSPGYDIPYSNNPLTLFFASFSESSKNILPEFHNELKMDILRIMCDYERRSRERQSESSTSRATNGA